MFNLHEFLRCLCAKLFPIADATPDAASDAAPDAGPDYISADGDNSTDAGGMLALRCRS